ncbi:MAG: SDR family NAD(P)-dependent oxidoreductase, partial [Clostridia bacterium]|nr:SDR family NAD(P)-dependent oxidoreductase [Clostridia bacterium]
IVPVALDLSIYKSYETLKNMLGEKKANVRILVNNAGYGILGELKDAEYVSQSGMIDLNCRALTAITTLVLPYMKKGSFVVNVCSIASFCPNARMTVYSSTKAFVLSFSKGIRFENKKNGINVLAVCPGPMETEFLSVAGINGNSKTFETLPYCDPVTVARRSLIYAEKGRGVYTPRMLYKFYRVLAKLLPHGIMMHITKT